MLHSAVFAKLIEKHPEAVMVRATLEQAFPAEFVDEVFERKAHGQYTRTLMFSAVVQLLSLVVCRVQKSVHSAIQSMRHQLRVTKKSVYNKLNGTEPRIVEAIVSESADRMAKVVDKINAPLGSVIPGWRTRILDGNHLASTEHRLKPLRTIGGGTLPGLALVVYDNERGMVERVYLSEDGHAQEREILLELLAEMKPGELWIADRNFATAVFMLQMKLNRCHFIVRRHAANGRIRELKRWRAAGETETGTVEEGAAIVEGEYDEAMNVRLIRVRLKSKTRDGDGTIELVTNLPKRVSAAAIAEAYRKRWRIETSFAELDRVFNGEIESLAHPRAALLAFGLAIVAYNTLGVVKAALRKKHGVDRIQNEMSLYYLGDTVQRSQSALDLLLDDAVWGRQFGSLTPRQLAARLISMAERVDTSRLKKHPRGPKKPQPPRIVDPKRPHVSTARILEEAKRNKKRAKTSEKAIAT